MRSIIALAICGLALSVTTTQAADIQVSYTVDDKALKSAVTATSLTFDLYADAACTITVDSANVLIDDVDLIERVKRFKPKGGVKPPNTARLVEVLSGVITDTTLYLKVTGTGIAPVGGDCQLQYVSSGGPNVPCLSQVGNEVYFDGCNVNVRSGTGSTFSAVNGRGNLVIGYNEDTVGPPNNRTGSHNIVIGTDHTYSSYAGIVAGGNNTVTSAYATITGGFNNTAGGLFASVSGGSGNSATGPACSVTGGASNTAGGNTSTVSGGTFNTASGTYAAVSGGGGNTASASESSVSGGQFNVANAANAAVSGGQSNTASATFSSVSGGQCNVAGAGPAPACTASTGTSSVSGGFMNVASANGGSVSGGECNVAGAGPVPDCSAHPLAGKPSVSGGQENLASGAFASVTGGLSNVASGGFSSVTGGAENTASGAGNASTVSGGHLRSAPGLFNWAGGGLFQNN